MSEPFLRPRQDNGGYDPRDQRQEGHEDPLAELARLVGRDDPFRRDRAVASNVARFPQVGAARVDAPVPPRYEPEPRFDPHRDTYEDAHEPTYEPHHHEGHGTYEDDLRFAPQATSVDAFEPALGYPTAAGRGEAPPLNADLWAEGAEPDAPSNTLFHEPAQAPAERASPRRTLIVLVAVLALTGGGIGATFLMRDGGAVRTGGGAPPTILAADTPAKVQSPDQSNGSTPDANTALLEKTGSDKVADAKVVSNTEQPVDLAQLPKASAGQGDGPVSASASPFPEPRKVKTVLIRPDGSVVGEAPAAAPAQAPIGMTLPVEAGGTPSAAQPAVAEPVAKPSTPKSTARASATPPAAGAGVTGAKQPAAPTHAAKPVAVAAASAADDAPAAAPGTWSVQLGAPPSEAEAKDMSSRLQKKFSGELGGLRPAIVKADKNGKPIYRVRVGNLAQADAKALCTKLQGGGGSCFVVRN